ncbi:sialoadhesin-like [Carassius auratus]|uniref:Sialoadhesin-like n=1 Tax=Carassius auratus TaxID=7957 RepID=A0A6P6PA76_CARAU|nr:sialoadhesin-like [Carassius auratus]
MKMMSSSHSFVAPDLCDSNLPRSTLTVTPDSPVFTGERVSLKCVIESNRDWRQRNGLTYDQRSYWTYYQTHVWRYEWNKDSVKLQSSDRYTVNTDTLTIRAVTTSDEGQYTCRGQRDERPNSSQSSSVSLSVKGVSPSVSLVVRPSRSQHFSSDSLSLSCEDQTNSSGWTVRRYTDRNTENCSKLTGSTCRLVSLNTSDSGVYWCQSESGEKSHRLNIIVHDGDVILESSVDPVIEGHTLTLHCLHRSTNSSILRADFYKDGSLVQNQTTGEMIITNVSKSDEGFYYCKTERGQSPHSWISVREKKENHSDLDQHLDGDVVLESSVDPVIEGHTLTLHCLHRSTNSSILRADFYKDGSLVQNQTTGEMIITTVSKSDEGFYYCKTERGQSPHSWISVREKKENHADLDQHLVSGPHIILGFLLAACPYLLATVVLLYKCYRARVPSTEDQSQYAVTEEET